MYAGVSRGAQITGVAAASLFLTWTSFILRMYVRTRLLKHWAREDWLTVSAMAVFTVLCALCLRETAYGLGAHMMNITVPALVVGFKLIYVCELLYVFSTLVTKLSVAAYFLRLASKKYQRITIYTTTAVAVVFSTMYIFFLIFQCTPVDYFWTNYLVRDGGQCFDRKAMSGVTYAHCVVSAVTDWIFGILPIFFVRKMKMNPKTKLSVVLVLSLGFFASTATVVRIYYINKLERTYDYSWEGINLVKWSMIEPAIAITAMNIATLRPLLRTILGRFETPTRRRATRDDEEMKRVSGDSRHPLRSRSASPAWDNEFADLLGLSRVGVITEITAERKISEKGLKRMITGSTRKLSSLTSPTKTGTGSTKTETGKTRRPGGFKLKPLNESQTELNFIPPSPLTERGHSRTEPFNFSNAIMATTTVTHSTS